MGDSGGGAVPGLGVTNSGGIGPGVLPHVVEFAVTSESVVRVDERGTLGEFTTKDRKPISRSAVYTAGETWRTNSRLQLQLGVVQSGDHVEMDGSEDGLGEDVQDTVEDHLRSRGDAVTTVGKTPGDGVEGPEGTGEAGASYLLRCWCDHE